MDFKDQVKQLGDRVVKLKDNIQTEEATKNAFIMPFIQCLGHDVFNPLEVVPEYITDIGTKKGEKIDYAIMKDNEPTILIECKHWAQNLNLHDGQLLRYFHVSKAKFGILTNGITYRFYTDLVETNKMDEKPFFEFNINEISDTQIEELKKFHKHYFDLEKIFNTASELKYTNEIKAMLSNELKTPSDEFVRYFATRIHPGKVTEKIKNLFADLVKKSCTQVLNELVNDRLKAAMTRETEAVVPEPVTVITPATLEEKKVETTVEEMESFMIVKAILRKKIDSSRICYRDYQNFFSVLLDDSNRKTVAKFYLNPNKKGVYIPDQGKTEVWFDLKTLDDIYGLSAQLETAVDVIDAK